MSKIVELLFPISSSNLYINLLLLSIFHRENIYFIDHFLGITHSSQSVLDNETHKFFWDFEIQTDHLLSDRRSDLLIINKKKKTCWIKNFADHRVRLKENEKKDKYQDLAKGLKKLWNIKVMVIPIVIGALGKVTKGWIERLEDLEIRGRVETIQTTALLRSARILWKVVETRGDLLSLKFQWETID